MRAVQPLYADRMTYPMAAYEYNPTIGQFFAYGYLTISAFLNSIRRISHTKHSVDRYTIRESFFSRASFSFFDFELGPYSDANCTAGRVGTTACQCHAGARQVMLSILDKTTFNFVRQEHSTVTFSLDKCIRSSLIQSPLIQLVASPLNATSSVDPYVAAAVDDFIVGDSAAYINASVGPSSRTGIITQVPYGSLDELAMVHEDELITVAVGGIYTEDITPMAHNISILLDPLYVVPQLYGGFNARVVYLSATMEQEIHALASVYSDTSIQVLTTVAAMASGLSAAFTRSVNTFGHHLGVAKSVASIVEGLANAGSGVIFVHGIETSADVVGINDYLGRQPQSIILIPFQHLVLWYTEFQQKILDPSRRARVMFATNLPNWNVASTSPAARSGLMQSYFRAMLDTGKSPTPRSLMGFLTQRLLANIVERIPSKLTQDTFLSTIYAVSVVVLDAEAYSIGPLSSAACVRDIGAGTTCETNVGARRVEVRSLDAALGTSPGIDTERLGLFVFASGVIDYRALPSPDGVNVVVAVVASVAGALALFIIVIVSIFCFCTGRSHAHAPKDQSKPFTIIFTDIQSSTNLWAEVPEEMGRALEVHHRLIRELVRKHKGYEVKTIGDAFMVAFKQADSAVRMAYELQHVFHRCVDFSTAIDRAYLAFDQQKIIEAQAIASDLGDLVNLSCNLPSEEYVMQWSGLRVRIGIHTAYGDIKKDEVTKAYDYYGSVTNTAARVEAVSHGGQVCFTEGTRCELSEVHIEPYESALPLEVLKMQNNAPSAALRLGAVELRGLADNVTLFQLECVVGRKFPPLRLDREPEEQFDGNNTKSCNSIHTSHSDLSNVSKSNAKVVSTARVNDSYTTQVLSTIATLFSVLPGQKRGKEIKRLCDLWRVKIDKSLLEKASVWSPSSGDILLPLKSASLASTSQLHQHAYHLGRQEPLTFTCLLALTNRVSGVAYRSYKEIVPETPAATGLSPKAQQLNTPPSLGTSVSIVKPDSFALNGRAPLDVPLHMVVEGPKSD